MKPNKAPIPPLIELPPVAVVVGGVDWFIVGCIRERGERLGERSNLFLKDSRLKEYKVELKDCFRFFSW